MKTRTKRAIAGSSRPLRADAERNRRLLLKAAARAFAEYGPEVSTVRIAQEAGVGQGTLYRRFPSKEHLIAAIVTDVLEDFAASAAEWQDADDAGTALHEFMASGVQLCLKNQGFLQAIAGALRLEDAGVAARYKEVLDLTGRLVARAQEQRTIRNDVTADDILSLVGAISNAGTRRHGDVPDLWMRYLDLIFDGLQPQAAHPLPHPPVDAFQLALASKRARSRRPRKVSSPKRRTG